MRPIVGLIGYGRSGKDTLAAQLTEYKRLAFADALKREVGTMLKAVGIEVDLHGEDKGAWRDLLIYWGRKRRETDKHYWLKKVAYDIVRQPDERFVVTDVRYLNEAKWIKDHEGVLVYINRPGYKAVSEEEAITIQQILREFEPPILVNDGTKQQLEEAFRAVMRSYYSWH